MTRTIKTIVVLLAVVGGVWLGYTKVVQRLPVRIAIDPDQELAPRLRPGMSVVVRVDTAAEPTRTP